MKSKTRTASRLNFTASVLVTCSALGLAAGCSSKQQTVSVQAGNPGGPMATSPSSSSSPTRPAKPAAEQVPDAARLSVVGQTVPGPGSTTARTAVLTDAATIREIAADINALPTLPHYTGKVHCPMELVGTTLTLDFRDSAAGPVLAVVHLGPQPSSQCNGGVQVTVGGTTEPQLDDSAQPKLFTQIEQLSGLTAS